MGKNGRIIGIKMPNLQIWNVYPQSGSNHKRDREIFFNEKLCNYMSLWKDQSRFVIQGGDHNCIHRKEDSVNNPGQHLQQGLIKHLRIHGLKDAFLACHGLGKIEYSRVTNVSATRIDYIFSNLKTCKQFEYLKLRGLDHKAGIATFEIELERTREQIPKHKLGNSKTII